MLEYRWYQRTGEIDSLPFLDMENQKLIEDLELLRDAIKMGAPKEQILNLIDSMIDYEQTIESSGISFQLHLISLN